MFKDQYRAVMQYSLPRDAGKPGDNGSPRLIHHDWICAKVRHPLITCGSLYIFTWFCVPFILKLM